jgi:hypothetical protein
VWFVLICLARGYNMYVLDVGVTAYNGPSPDATICTDTITGVFADSGSWTNLYHG